MGENFNMTPPSAGRSAGVPVLSSVAGFEAVDRTFPQLLCDRERFEPDTVAFQSWSGGAMRRSTWRDYLDEVREIALGLHGHGIGTRDRVAVLAGTRHEWVVAALAILSVGGIPVGVHQTSSLAEIRHVLDNCRATAIVVETANDAEKLASLTPQPDHLRLAVGLDADPAGLADGVAATTWE